MIKNKTLIAYCYKIAGRCDICRHWSDCDKFQATYGNEPYEADELYPEQFNDGLVGTKGEQ